MVAFSCCTYEGGSKENNAMENARERSWRGKFHRPGRVINPEANRRNGRCPLTPLEVATFFFLEHAGDLRIFILRGGGCNICSLKFVLVSEVSYLEPVSCFSGCLLMDSCITDRVLGHIEISFLEYLDQSHLIYKILFLPVTKILEE